MNKKTLNILLSLSLAGANLFSPHVLWSAPRKPNPDYQAYSSKPPSKMVVLAGLKMNKDGSFCAVDARGRSALTPRFALPASVASPALPGDLPKCGQKETKQLQTSSKTAKLNSHVKKTSAGVVLKMAGGGCILGSIASWLDELLNQYNNNKPPKKTTASTKAFCETCEQNKNLNDIESALAAGGALAVGGVAANTAGAKAGAQPTLHKAYTDWQAATKTKKVAANALKQLTQDITAEIQQLKSQTQSYRANLKMAKQTADTRPIRLIRMQGQLDNHLKLIAQAEQRRVDLKNTLKAVKHAPVGQVNQVLESARITNIDRFKKLQDAILQARIKKPKIKFGSLMFTQDYRDNLAQIRALKAQGLVKESKRIGGKRIFSVAHNSGLTDKQLEKATKATKDFNRSYNDMRNTKSLAQINQQTYNQAVNQLNNLQKEPLKGVKSARSAGIKHAASLKPLTIQQYLTVLPQRTAHAALQKINPAAASLFKAVAVNKPAPGGAGGIIGSQTGSASTSVMKGVTASIGGLIVCSKGTAYLLAPAAEAKTDL